MEATRCAIHTLDCTGDYAVPEALESRVTFHRVCVGDKTDDALDFKSWDDALTAIGATGVDLLKIDVEGYEYSILPAMARSTAPLPDQVVLEVHATTYIAPPLLRSKGTGGLRPKWFPGEACASPPELALFGHFLFYGAGYLIADRRDHPVCESCTELTLVKARCRSPALAGALASE